MISEQELNAAIAECLGEREPDAHTCYKLASFYTIRAELFGNTEQSEMSMPKRSYSADNGNTVQYSSESEFGQTVNGMDSMTAWTIIEELMTTLYAVDKPLYRSVMRRFRE